MRMFPAFGLSRPSLKRKLFGYMLLLALILLFALASGLFLSGSIRSEKEDLSSAIELQMEFFKKDMEAYWDDTAVMSIDLSEEMTFILEKYLYKNSLTFDSLTDNSASLCELQELMIESASLQLRQSECSGVFILLDTTVNSKLDNSAHSRSGLYLQKSGVDSPNTSILLYRGIPDIGKKHNIMPHRKWKLEFNTELFPDFNSLPTDLPLEESYYITNMIELPGTYEHAALMTVPMAGSDGTIYGFCGFEVSRSYFKSHHAQPSNLDHMICMLTKGSDDELDADTGYSCGISRGYYYETKGKFSINDIGRNLISLKGAEDSYIGVIDEITIDRSGAPYKVAVMIPKSDYDHASLKSTLQITLLTLLIIFVTAVCCFYFSRRFLSPVLRELEKIKSDKREKSSIPEIDDLFAFLADQDRRHEEKLKALTIEKQNVINEKELLRSEFEKAQTEYASAQAEIARLAYSRKQEVDPASYQVFLEGIDKLTRTERKIFDYYLSGKTVKEIMEISEIKESTLRYHNQNIYGKLGVNSLKQLLRYASLMNHE